MRDVARLFKEAGRDGLPDAVQRADHATYQEVRCRSALNRVQGMPFKWTLNPYRGCTHGCHYCFARRYQDQLEMEAGDDFSSVILVKVNFPKVLRVWSSCAGPQCVTSSPLGRPRTPTSRPRGTTA